MRKAIVVPLILLLIAITASGFLLWNSGRNGIPDANNIGSSNLVARAPSNSGERASVGGIAGGQISIPVRYQFDGVRKVLTAPNEAALLARYSPTQKDVIEAFYRSYGAGVGGVSSYSFDHVFSFKNEKQLEWLVTNGYPTPDDILAASRMTDDDLKALSINGNFKEGVFYLQRLADKQALRLKDGQGTSSADRPLVKELADAAELEARLAAEGSPFGAYALVQRGISMNKSGNVIAGYAYARTLGDTRADDFSAAYSQAHGGVSATETIAAYQTITGAAAIRNAQLANARDLMRRSQFPMF